MAITFRAACLSTTALAALIGTTLPAHSAPPVGIGFGASNAIIRVDANRDGFVTFRGDDDGSKSATATTGALFLPNLDDDQKRCAPDAVACNDASDAVVNGPDDERDLAIARTAGMQVSMRAKATVTLAPGQDRYARLFLKRHNGTWEHLTDKTNISPSDIHQGLTIGVEGKTPATDLSVWDGTIKLTYRVQDLSRDTTDFAVMRVAPLLTHHHGQTADQVVMSAPDFEDYIAVKRDMTAATKRIGVPKPLQNIGGPDVMDVWTQDFMEPFYASMPGVNGPQSMRVLVMSDQDRGMDGVVAAELRGKDVGMFTYGERKGGTRSSFGNLETVPPHTAPDGTHYPAGRMITGIAPGIEADGMHAMTEPSMKLFAAQQMQKPIILDTGWLNVGHVDEFVQFLPANNARGFKVAVSDPRLAMQTLREAQQAGHGKAPAAQRTSVGRLSIDEMLTFPGLQEQIDLSVSKIEANLDVLRREVGITDADIVRVPALYIQLKFANDLYGTPPEEPGDGGDDGGDGGEGDDALRPGQPDRAKKSAAKPAKPLSQFDAATKGQRRFPSAAVKASSVPEDPGTVPGDSMQLAEMMFAVYPMAVNSVVASDNTMIVAQQWGPLVEGKDILGEAVRKAYRSAGFGVEFVDDLTTYHSGGGELHCGSNTLRRMDPRWWRMA